MPALAGRAPGQIGPMVVKRRHRWQGRIAAPPFSPHGGCQGIQMQLKGAAVPTEVAFLSQAAL